MINNRPEFLNSLEYYREVPEAFAIDKSFFPKLLSEDISFLSSSCQPYTDGGLTDPRSSKKNIEEFYQSKGVTFQLVNIVANVYDFIEVSNIKTAIPYSLSIVPSMKRGKPQFIDLELAMIFVNSPLIERKSYYTHFNPFERSYGLIRFRLLWIDEKQLY